MPVNIAISVEGQTEESFIKQILMPYLLAKNIFVEPIIVKTKKMANHSFKGGTISFEKSIRDISRLLTTKYDLVTTFYDYYGLHKDFIPEHTLTNSYEIIKLIEDKMSVHINNEKFIPYIQLHEFETFLFIESDTTVNNLMDCRKNLVEQSINKALQQANNNPELVNNSPETAPSKRILKAYSSYQKITDGTNICRDLGIQKIREHCPHFDNWISTIITRSEEILATRVSN